MDELLRKYYDYMRLKDCRVEYLLDTGDKICFEYSEKAFIHLIGLHKLKDIHIIQLFNDKSNKKYKAKDVIRRVKSGRLNDAMVRKSNFFTDIQSRYENFSYENLTTLNYTDAIINFNPTPIKSKLKSDYILFEKNVSGEYNHLGIAMDQINNKRYVETFFHQSTDMYINGQVVVKVHNFRIYDAQGNVIVSDCFK